MPEVSGGTKFLNPTWILEKAGLAQDMKVGDLGCGSGYFTIPAARMVGQKGTIYAVDILKSALEMVESRARLENILNIKTIWSNLEIPRATKIADSKLDLALLINILFQSKMQKEILEEARRMTKIGGKLLVVDWQKTSAPFGPKVEMRVHSKKVRKLAQEIGLKEIEQFKAGQYHYGIIFQKL